MKITGSTQRDCIGQHGIEDSKKRALWANLHVRFSIYSFTLFMQDALTRNVCVFMSLRSDCFFWPSSSQRPCFKKLQERDSDARRQHVCSVVAYTGLEGKDAEECCDRLSNLWLRRLDQPVPFTAYVSHLALLLVQHARGYITDDMAAEMEFTRLSFESERANRANDRVFEMSRIMDFGKLAPRLWQLLQVFNILYHNMRTVPNPPKGSGCSVDYYVIVVCEVRVEGTQRFRIPVAVLIFGNVSVKFAGAPKKSFIYSHFLLTRAAQKVCSICSAHNKYFFGPVASLNS